MPTASSSATSISSSSHSIVIRVPYVARAWRFAPWLAAALFAAGCVTVPPPAPPTPTPAPLPATYRAVAWSAVPGWNDDAVDEAWPAFRVGCRALVASPARAAIWQGVCSAAANVDGSSTGAVRAFFERHFTPYQVLAADGADTGLVTGYYEPLLAGSRAASPRFGVPLYAAPDDLLTIDLVALYPELKGKTMRGRIDGKRVVPYWSRAEIETGRAALDSKVLVYVDDPVDAFFLQIQGSGRVRLDDGSVIRVGYADQNGHPYRSIGRVLIDRGELTAGEATLPGIRDWGRRNPDKLPALLDENPSYVFFREVSPPAPGTLDAQIDGPLGSLGVPLLRQRTIAVDTRAVPLGTPVFLATTMPLSSAPLRRLVLAQDTGGAIRGAVRADYFWGFGEEAGRQAGRMRQQGQMWLLWPRDARLPQP
jgi:membrane-bound lytic murein transglycosylase A